MIFKLNTNLVIKSRVLVSNYCQKRLFGAQNEFLDNERHLKRFPLITCKELYQRSDSKFSWYLRFAPKDGIEVNVECVDTKPNDKLKPTLVALHGCPGSHMDYVKLVSEFGNKYRVIVPNFPDFSVTDSQNCFWHSAKEKAQYVRDVLKALDVQRIDCLIAHSSAIFPASYLWLKDDPLNSDIQLKSLCLLSNPGPKWYSKKGRFVSSIVVNISRVPQIRRQLRQIWSKKMSKLLGIKNKIERFDDLALLFSTFKLSDTPSVHKRLQKLNEQNIPTLSVFSSRDRLFKDEIFYSLFEILKTDYEVFDVYEEHQNKLIQKSTKDDWIKVVDIRSGGHYVFLTHFDLVHKYIEELLQKAKV